ncbi:MAG: hypothetical protein U0R50_08400 [Gaiellales bacterium]
MERFSALGDPYDAAYRGAAGGHDALVDALGRLDATLGEAPWLTGTAFGLADIAYLPWVYCGHRSFSAFRSPASTCSRTGSTVASRPAVAAEAEIVPRLQSLV